MKEPANMSQSTEAVIAINHGKASAEYISKVRGWKCYEVADYDEALELIVGQHIEMALLLTCKPAAVELLRFSDSVARRSPAMAYGFLCGESEESLLQSVVRMQINQDNFGTASADRQIAFVHGDFNFGGGLEGAFIDTPSQTGNT